MMVFCYEVVQEVYQAQTAVERPKLDFRTKRYLVQRHGKKS